VVERGAVVEVVDTGPHNPSQFCTAVHPAAPAGVVDPLATRHTTATIPTASPRRMS
jgi:hypothetical protein